MEDDHSCCSPTETAMFGNDFNPCLDVNKITSVFSSFNLRMFFAVVNCSLCRFSLMLLPVGRLQWFMQIVFSQIFFKADVNNFFDYFEGKW